MSQQLTKNSQLLLTMNFHDETMMLNEGILEALGRPRQVQILLVFGSRFWGRKHSTALRSNRYMSSPS